MIHSLWPCISSYCSDLRTLCFVWKSHTVGVDINYYSKQSFIKNVASVLKHVCASLNYFSYFSFFFHFLSLKAMSVEAQTILGPIQTVQDS